MTDSYYEIEKLLYVYAERLDGGDLEGVAEMFADAAILGPSGDDGVRGRDQVLAMYQGSTRLYEDGTPHTRHVITNPIIEISEDGDSATCRAYFTVFQALPDFPLQPVIAGRYEDEFQRVNGTWRFAQRRMLPNLLGDLSHHLLFDSKTLES